MFFRYYRFIKTCCAPSCKATNRKKKIFLPVVKMGLKTRTSSKSKGSEQDSGKLPTYPSPKPTLTTTQGFSGMLGVGEKLPGIVYSGPNVLLFCCPNRRQKNRAFCYFCASLQKLPICGNCGKFVSTCTYQKPTFDLI